MNFESSTLTTLKVCATLVKIKINFNNRVHFVWYYEPQLCWDNNKTPLMEI